MENIQKILGQNLRREINRKHLKYGEAADLCEISLSFLNQLMKGTTAPSLEVLYRIIEKLEITSEALLFGDSTPVVERPKGIDPNTLLNAEAIANALNDMNKRLSAIAPANASVARIAARLAALDENQLTVVDGLIDDLLARTTTDIPHSKVR